MITIDNKTYRNLQEQVFKNMQDISDILGAEKVLADFGIKVIGNYATYDALIEAHPESSYLGDFGTCFTIGTEAPYTYYVWTRTSDTTKRGIWFNIGTFPMAGPQGATGATGPQGPQGNPGVSMLSGNGAPSSDLGSEGQLYLNLDSSSVYKKTSGVWSVVASIKGQTGANGSQGPQGPQGPQGATGPQGPQGDVGGFINIQGHVDSTANLPNPATLTNRTWAYLVGSNNDLYVQIPTTPGGSTYQWQNFGQLNVGTYVTVNGTYVNTYEMNNKLDKVTSTSSYYRIYAVASNGTNFMINGSSIEALGSSIAIRNANGQIKTATPTADGDAANKSYVDMNTPELIRFV